MVITLRTNGDALEFRYDSTDWCHLALLMKGQRIELGADVRGIVIERMLRALADDPNGEIVGEIEGTSVVLILSLSEEHGSIFATRDEGGMRTLFFQGADGRLLHRFRCTREDRTRWTDLLQNAESVNKSETLG